MLIIISIILFSINVLSEQLGNPNYKYPTPSPIPIAEEELIEICRPSIDIDKEICNMMPKPSEEYELEHELKHKNMMPYIKNKKIK